MLSLGLLPMARGAAADALSTETVKLELYSSEPDLVCYTCRHFIGPDRDWTVTLFGNVVGLQQWYDSTTIVVGDFHYSVPVRAPIVAGGIGTALALLLVGAAVTLRPRGGVRAEAS